MNEIANYIYINQYTSNHHQHSDSVTRQVHTMITLTECKFGIELMHNYIVYMMTHLQHCLAMYGINFNLALHPLDSVQDMYTTVSISCRSFSYVYVCSVYLFNHNDLNNG